MARKREGGQTDFARFAPPVQLTLRIRDPIPGRPDHYIPFGKPVNRADLRRQARQNKTGKKR